MKEWGVRVVPLFMLFRDGQKIMEWSGAKPDILKVGWWEGLREDSK